MKKVMADAYIVKTKSGVRTFASLGGASVYAQRIEFDEFKSITKKKMELSLLLKLVG